MDFPISILWKRILLTEPRTAGFSIETVLERSVSGVDVPVLTVDYLRVIVEKESEGNGW